MSLLEPSYDRFTLADAAMAGADPALPGLGTLLDPAALADALAASSPAAIGAVEPRQLRYAPGRSCLLLCDVEADGVRLPVYLRAERACDLGRLAVMAARAPAATPLGWSGLLLDDLSAVALAFPNDRRLPAAGDFTLARGTTGLLGPLVAGLGRGARFELVRWRPERRAVARVMVGNRPRAAVKVLAASAAAPALTALRALRGGGALRLPRVLATNAVHGAYATEWLRGVALEVHLGGAFAEPAVLEAVGAALADLHAQAAPPLAMRDRAARCAALRDRGAVVERLDPGSGAHELALRCAERLERLPRRTVAVHGDLRAAHVHVSGGDVALLDLDRAALDHPAVDLGALAADLERHALTGGLRRFEAEVLHEALLAGYAARSGRDLPAAELTAHVAAALVERSADAFEACRRGWRTELRALLRRAGALLDDGPR